MLIMKRKKVGDIVGEVCVCCNEESLEARREREYFRHGQAFVIIENVPFWVCTKCGERYHHVRVYKKMRLITAHSDQLIEHVSVPLARYQEDKTA